MANKEFKCSRDYWELIPDGTYEAQCIKYDEKFVLGKSRKLFLNFKIVDLGEHHGKEIFQAFLEVETDHLHLSEARLK